jgi:four helix bundle protein
VAVRTYRDFEAWKLASEVKRRVLVATASAQWNGHFWLRDQLRRSASSACANIAEGFGRYRPREFARFLSIAKGSLNELVEHISDAELLGLMSSADAASLVHTTRRADRTVTRLIKYLRSAPTND